MWTEETFALADQSMSMSAPEEIASERGVEGVVLRFDDGAESRRAIVTVLAKLPAIDNGASGIAATSMDDAFAHGITGIFDLTAPPGNRDQWRTDNSEYLDRHGFGADWQPRDIVIDGQPRSARYLTYHNACAYAIDAGSTFLVVAFSPAEQMPELRTQDRSKSERAQRL
jgi:hypothetical protein